MKLYQKFVAVLVMIAAFALTAKAQFDPLGQQRTIYWVPTQTVNAGSSSNFCVDLHGFQGVAKVDISSITNGACSAGTLTLYTSSDRTNWLSLSNYAVATQLDIVYTNSDVVYSGAVYPGPMLATNHQANAGTKTFPSPSVSGFVTSYIAPAPFTNSGVITLTNGTQTIGFIVENQQRYVQAFYSFTGSSTNTISATMTVHKQQE